MRNARSRKPARHDIGDEDDSEEQGGFCRQGHVDVHQAERRQHGGGEDWADQHPRAGHQSHHDKNARQSQPSPIRGLLIERQYRRHHTTHPTHLFLRALYPVSRVRAIV